MALQRGLSEGRRDPAAEAPGTTWPTRPRRRRSPRLRPPSCSAGRRAADADHHTPRAQRRALDALLTMFEGRGYRIHNARRGHARQGLHPHRTSMSENRPSWLFRWSRTVAPAPVSGRIPRFRPGHGSLLRGGPVALGAIQSGTSMAATLLQKSGCRTPFASCRPPDPLFGGSPPDHEVTTPQAFDDCASELKVR